MAVIDELIVRVGANLEPLEESFESAGRTTRRFTDKIQRYGKKLDRMRITPVIRLVDKASPQLQRLEGKLRYFSKRTYEATVKINDKAMRGVDKLRQKVSGLGTAAAIGGIGVGLIGYNTLSTYASFEQQMANLRALTGATDTQFSKLTNKAKELGETTAFSASEAGQGMQYLAMAGFEVNQILDSMPGMLNLAAAASVDLGTAADITSNIMSGFNMKAEEATRVADVLAKTVTSSNTTMEELGITMKYIAPVASSVGMSLEQTAAAAGILASAGIKGSQAGTTLRASLLRLSDPPREAITQLEKLGVKITDLEGNFRPFGDILKDFKDRFNDLSKAQQVMAVSTIFGQEAASGMLALIRSGGKDFDNFVDKLNEAGGTAKEMADIQLNTLSGSMKLLGSRVASLQLAIGDELGPVIRDFADWISEQIPYVKRWAEEVMPKLADSFRRATGWIKRFVEGLRDSEKFKRLDWAGKIVFVLDRIIDSMNNWLSGEGGEKVEQVFTKLAEIAGRAWLNTLGGLMKGTLKELGQGDIKGAGGLGLLFYLLGGGLAIKGITGLMRTIGKGSKTAGTILSQTGKIGTATAEAGIVTSRTGKVLSSIGKYGGKLTYPLMIGGEILNVATAKDKTKAVAKSAGGLGGAYAGGTAGAAIGTAILPGIGTVVGAGIGGLVGYFGGRYIGGKAIEGYRKSQIQERERRWREQLERIKMEYGRKTYSPAQDFYSIRPSRSPAENYYDIPSSPIEMLSGNGNAKSVAPNAFANNMNGDVNLNLDEVSVNLSDVQYRIQEDKDELANEVGHRIIKRIEQHLENS